MDLKDDCCGHHHLVDIKKVQLKKATKDYSLLCLHQEELYVYHHLAVMVTHSVRHFKMFHHEVDAIGCKFEMEIGTHQSKHDACN